MKKKSQIISIINYIPIIIFIGIKNVHCKMYSKMAFKSKNIAVLTETQPDDGDGTLGRFYGNYLSKMPANFMSCLEIN